MKTYFLLNMVLLAILVNTVKAYSDQVRGSWIIVKYPAESSKVQNLEEEENQIDHSWAYYAPYYR